MKKENNLYGLVSVLLGLIACWLPLSQPGVGSGYSGFAVTTAGITAVVLAGKATSRILPAIGGTLGVVGTILCVWSLAAFYAPGSVPPAPSLATLTNSTQTVEPHLVDGAALGSARGARVVAPLEGANVTAPAAQLRANLRHVVFNLGAGLNASRDYGGGLPSGLSIGPDGTVSSTTATYSRLPADMHLGYIPARNGTSYRLTITDVESGMAVSYDSALNQVVDQ